MAGVMMGLPGYLVTTSVIECLAFQICMVLTGRRFGSTLMKLAVSWFADHLQQHR